MPPLRRISVRRSLDSDGYRPPRGDLEASSLQVSIQGDSMKIRPPPSRAEPSSSKPASSMRSRSSTTTGRTTRPRCSPGRVRRRRRRSCRHRSCSSSKHSPPPAPTFSKSCSTSRSSLTGVAHGVELRLGDCMLCGGLVVVDGLALRDIRCGRCSEASQLHC